MERNEQEKFSGIQQKKNMKRITLYWMSISFGRKQFSVQTSIGAFLCQSSLIFRRVEMRFEKTFWCPEIVLHVIRPKREKPQCCDQCLLIRNAFCFSYKTNATRMMRLDLSTAELFRFGLCHFHVATNFYFACTPFVLDRKPLWTSLCLSVYVRVGACQLPLRSHHITTHSDDAKQKQPTKKEARKERTKLRTWLTYCQMRNVLISFTFL